MHPMPPRSGGLRSITSRVGTKVTRNEWGALHPDLQKRIVEKDPKTGNARLREMSASMLVGYTRDGEGTKTPKEKQQKDVTIFDICRDEASAKVVFLEWVDYLHLARFDGRWVIVNVLWQYKPKSPES